LKEYNNALKYSLYNKNINKLKKILITGGCGFLGTNLIDILLKKKVKILNLDKVSYSSNKKYQKNYKNYQFKKIDISKISYKKIKNILIKFKPTHIVNLAAESHVDRSIHSIGTFIENNIIGTLNLLNALKDYKLKKNVKFIHVGTDEIYGDLKNKNAKFKATSPIDPKNPYSATKASAILILKSFGNTYGINFIIVNPSNLFGPYQFTEKLIPRNILLAKRDGIMQLYGTGLNKRSWLFIDDFIDAFLLIISKGKLFRTYLPGSNYAHTNKYVLNKILKIFKSDLKKNIEIIFVKDRKGHDLKYFNDNRDLKKMGWKQKHNITMGLRKTIKWYLNSQNINLFKKIDLELLT